MTKTIKSDKKLLVKKTEGEWRLIYKKLKELPGKKRDFNSYVRHETWKMLQKFEKCPNCLTVADGPTKKKRPLVSDETYEGLKIIAKKMDIPVCDVIEYFIINPLLHGHPIEF